MPTKVWNLLPVRLSEQPKKMHILGSTSLAHHRRAEYNSCRQRIRKIGTERVHAKAIEKQQGNPTTMYFFGKYILQSLLVQRSVALACARHIPTHPSPTTPIRCCVPVVGPPARLVEVVPVIGPPARFFAILSVANPRRMGLSDISGGSVPRVWRLRS